MLPLTLQFLIAMIASAINERLQRRLDYALEEVRVLKEKRQVPTITLDDLLGRAGVAHVDFLSLDIEGAEPAALAGFSIGRYQPGLACVEIHSAEHGRAINEHFTLHGYREVTAYRSMDPINRYFAPAP